VVGKGPLRDVRGRTFGYNEDNPCQFGWGYDHYRGCPEVNINWAVLQAYYSDNCIDVPFMDVIHQACELVGAKLENGEIKHGYIDHQSIGNSCEIFASPESMATFLFGENSEVIIDNDNY
jgi:hypothetical protein